MRKAKALSPRAWDAGTIIKNGPRVQKLFEHDERPSSEPKDNVVQGQWRMGQNCRVKAGVSSPSRPFLGVLIFNHIFYLPWGPHGILIYRPKGWCRIKITFLDIPLWTDILMVENRGRPLNGLLVVGCPSFSPLPPPHLPLLSPALTIPF